MKNLTVGELKALISDAVKESVQVAPGPERSESWRIALMVRTRPAIGATSVLTEPSMETTKLKNLTVGELKALISDIVKESVEDLIKNPLALSSDEYSASIE